jgi:nucleoside-diphosphate-sugar epimerase
MNQNKIAILGCGWLGLPLAKKLISKNFIVRGSTTSKDKISVLEKENIEPFLITLDKEFDEKKLIQFLKNIDILIINIPPKIRSNKSVDYYNKIEKILLCNNCDKINNIIFISSTSVYGSKQGKINSKTNPIPDTINGIEILKTEELLKTKKNTIVRFGGLIGEDRNPLSYLLKKKEVLNPNAPINYIHLEDCIGIIISIIEKNMWGKTYLGVTPYHPTKKEYYDKLCKIRGVKNLIFSKEKTTTNKEINDNKINEELKYSFKRKNL